MAPDAPPGPEAASAPRPELGDAPPFATWPRIYLIVLGALALQVILYAALTAAYR
ncbi:MAG TPA: hypothetical protein VMT47_05755 [Polyangia bacterium]|nr:hypothetical protein [Polyangia bacterium]